MTESSELTVNIVTPQSWLKEYQPKPRRLTTAQRRNAQRLKQHKLLKAKDLLLQELLDSQTLTRVAAANGSQFDPFQSFPIPTSSSVANMAQYFLQAWAPQHGRAFAFEGHENPYLSLIWPFALQTEVYFEALMAVCGGTLLAVQGRPAHEDKPFMNHRANAMCKLRQRLQDPEKCADDATILAVTSLGTIDYILGEHAVGAAHAAGVRQMIKIRGGFNTDTPWERLLQSSVTAYEALWSFLFAVDISSVGPTVDKSHLPRKSGMPTYLSHPFPPDVCEMLAKVPRGLTDLGLTGVLSVQIIRVLSQATPLIQQLSKTPVVGKQEMTLRPKMQTLLEDIHRQSTMRTTVTERFLTYGLIAYCYMIRNIHFDEALTGFYESALKILTEVALKQAPCHKLPDRKCYLWTYMMIGTVLQNSQHPPTQWRSVMQQFFRLYREAKSWKSLTQELELFFWDNDIQRVCKVAYDEAVQRMTDSSSLGAKPQESTTRTARQIDTP